MRLCKENNFHDLFAICLTADISVYLENYIQKIQTPRFTKTEQHLVLDTEISMSDVNIDD